MSKIESGCVNFSVIPTNLSCKATKIGIIIQNVVLYNIVQDCIFSKAHNDTVKGGIVLYM